VSGGFKEIRYAFARWLWKHGRFNAFVNRLRSRKNIPVIRFDIIFDGFPRSSNTYGAFMLMGSQQDRLKVLMHEHRPSVFHRAAQLGKPACLTVRDPLDATVSWMIYTGSPAAKVLDSYIFFYEVLLPDRSKFLVLPFSVIIDDYPLVLRLMNLRFGLNLETDIDVDGCRDEAFRRIEKLFTDEKGILDPRKVPRPEEGRRELYEIYQGEYRRDLARLRPSTGSSRTDFQLPRMSR
jgi:hypothetical protein